MSDFIKPSKVLLFLSGVAAPSVVKAIMASPKARELAVKGVAKGMKFKNEVEVAFQNIKEDAEDIYHDARLEINGE
ncbi:MAG: DUF1490 domain-containing protein [Eubacteriaceae bacterium]|jgi:hypothetical protein|nr:DUF1490 domain-containing protein [Eubacteriaceae bacterium]